jgi:hypothetical protein
MSSEYPMNQFLKNIEVIIPQKGEVNIMDKVK